MPVYSDRIDSSDPSFTADDARFAMPVFKEIDVELDVVFVENIEHEGNRINLKLDVYQPKGDTLSKRPTLFYIHGGGFQTGDKSEHARICTDLAKYGYLVVSVNYRLTDREMPDYPECRKAGLEDVRSAVQWLLARQEKYRPDPNRIGFIGESAGGLLSFGAGYESQSFWEGVLDKKGIFAIVNMYGSHQYQIVSIERDAPPMLLIHGDQDTWVPYRFSTELLHELQQAGIRSELFTMVGEEHKYFDKYYDEVVTRSAAFFRASL